MYGHLIGAFLMVAACKGPKDETGLDSLPGSFLAEVPSAIAPETRLLRVSYPAVGRYADGAPVLVEVPGGTTGGDLVPMSGADTWGWVVVVPLLPGGEAEGLTAEGAFDYRGPASAEAVRDALRYGAGLLPDTQGLTLDQRLRTALSGDPITLVGRSNGGNLALAALSGLEGVEVGALVQAESPVGDQFVTLELNHNPYYQPGTCTPTTCPWPGLTEVIAVDPYAETAATGFLVEDTGYWPGRIYLDEDGSGERTDPEKSFKRLALGEVDGERLLFPSVELSASLVGSGLEPPPWLASPEEVEGYWSQRDGSRFVAAVAQSYPELVVMLTGTEEDHFQTAPDHPHLLSHHQGWLDAGHRLVRLNGDAAYLALTSGHDEALLPDCPAGSPLAWPGVEDCLVPEELEGEGLNEATLHAAILEAVDRVHSGERSPDLDGVLY